MAVGVRASGSAASTHPCLSSVVTRHNQALHVSDWLCLRHTRGLQEILGNTCHGGKKTNMNFKVFGTKVIAFSTNSLNYRPVSYCK